MLPRAVTARVAYVPGTGFYADGLGSRQLRLSYCYPTPDRIREGVRRLAGVLEAELDVLHTFGSPARPAVGHGRRCRHRAAVAPAHARRHDELAACATRGDADDRCAPSSWPAG